MSDKMQSALDWVLDRLSENSTWRGIIGALTAAGVVIKPDMGLKIVAAGMGAVAVINILRKAPPSKAQVADALATKQDLPADQIPAPTIAPTVNPPLTKP